MHRLSFSDLSIGDSKIYLCEFEDFDISDYEDQLTLLEKQQLFSFKSKKRKQEFVATRILRHSIFGFQHIHYDSLGAPYIENAGYISVSHSKQKVGIALNEKYKIGLDLEDPRERVLKVMHKFLSDEEKHRFDVNNPMEIIKIWSAKEAMYKLAGRKGIHFRKELILDKKENEIWNGRIINPNHELLIKLNIFEYKNTIVSINSEEIVKRTR